MNRQPVRVGNRIDLSKLLRISVLEEIQQHSLLSRLIFWMLFTRKQHSIHSVIFLIERDLVLLADHDVCFEESRIGFEAYISKNCDLAVGAMIKTK